MGLREWPPQDKASKPIPKGPAPWIDNSDTKSELMDPRTAQVVPGELCTKLFKASGAKLVIGAARGLETRTNEDGVTCTAVKTDDATVECDVVIVSMGVWSVLLEDWLHDEGVRVPLEGVYSSSIVYEGTTEVAEKPFALFCAEDSNDCHLECYPRPDGSIYICGIGGSDYVRGARLREEGDLQDATLMKANDVRVAAAKASFSKIAPSIAENREPIKTQACMRPCAPDALPLLGLVPGTENVILAAGHNCCELFSRIPAPIPSTGPRLTPGLRCSVILWIFPQGEFSGRRSPVKSWPSSSTRASPQWTFLHSALGGSWTGVGLEGGPG